MASRNGIGTLETCIEYGTTFSSQSLWRPWNGCVEEVSSSMPGRLLVAASRKVVHKLDHPRRLNRRKFQRGNNLRTYHIELLLDPPGLPFKRRDKHSEDVQLLDGGPCQLPLWGHRASWNSRKRARDDSDLSTTVNHQAE